MRNILKCLVLSSLLVVAGSLSAVVADPAPPFSETIADPSAFDITRTLLSGALDTWTYQWDLTFYGLDTDTNPHQFLGEMAVYDDAAKYKEDDSGIVELLMGDSYGDVTAQWAVWRPEKAGLAIEWRGPKDQASRVEPPSTLRMTANLDRELTAPDWMVALHIQGTGPDGEDSEWVNPTPQLAPSALMGLGMLPLGIAYLRKRRCRSE